MLVRLAVASGFAAALALLPATASAAVINVPCSSESSAQVLQDAVLQANSSPGPDTISLAAGCTYTFSQGAFQGGGWFGSNALPPIASEITIEGNGATLTREDTIFSSTLRFFFVGADPTRPETLDYVTPGAGKLTIRDLTLKDGHVRGGASFGGGGGAGMGGAIFNMGTTVIERSTLTGNSAVGGAGDGSSGGQAGGGGIASASISLDGGGMQSLGGQFGADGGAGGMDLGGGGGGAGFRVGQTGSNATTNLPGDGGGPDTGTGGVGGGQLALGGDGAGSGGWLPGLMGQTGDGGDFGQGGTGFNTKAAGGGGVGGGGGSPAVPGGGGGGGFGGGGGSGPGGGGGGGFGGGAADGPAPAATPGYGAGAADPADGVGHFAGGGGAGMGGAIFNLQGEVTVINSTIAGNSAAGGAPQTLPSPAQGLGGAVFNLNGDFTAIGSTFDNSATSHATSIYNLVYDHVETRAAQVTLRDTIVAHGEGGAPEDVVSERNAIVLAGNADAALGERDIVQNSTALTGGTLTGTPITDDPLLQPLANNGGPTETMLPGAGSPARDAGSAFGLTTDQRGLCRPFDIAGVPNFSDGTDIGSVEVGAQPCPVPPQTPPHTGAASFGPKPLITLSLAAKRIGRKGVVPVRVRNGNSFAVSGRLGAKRKRARTKTKRFSVRANARKTVKLKLPRSLRRLLVRKHRLTLRLSAVVQDPAGHKRSVVKTVKPRLKSHRRHKRR